MFWISADCNALPVIKHLLCPVVSVVFVTRNTPKMPPPSKKAAQKKAKPESSSSDDDDDFVPYAMHFGPGGETIMSSGAGTPSPMMLLLMNTVGQVAQNKLANDENDSNNASNQVESASGCNGNGMVVLLSTTMFKLIVKPMLMMMMRMPEPKVRLNPLFLAMMSTRRFLLSLPRRSSVARRSAITRSELDLVRPFSFFRVRPNIMANQFWLKPGEHCLSVENQDSCASFD